MLACSTGNSTLGICGESSHILCVCVCGAYECVLQMHTPMQAHKLTRGRCFLTSHLIPMRWSLLLKPVLGWSPSELACLPSSARITDVCMTLPAFDMVTGIQIGTHPFVTTAFTH